MRLQIISAAPLKFGEEVRRPIGTVHLQAVTENGIGRISSKGLHEFFTDSVEVMFDGGAAVMIEHEAFRADAGAFHLLAGATGNEVEFLFREVSDDSFAVFEHGRQVGLFNPQSS